MVETRVLVGTVLTAGLVLGACGGDNDASSAVTSAPPTATVAATATTATTAPATQPTTDPGDAAAATTSPMTGAPATTAASATTVPAPEPTEFDLAELPALVEQLTDITAIDPLAYAMALGFPLDVPVPDGSTLYRVDITVDTRDEATDGGAVREVGIEYSVIAPGGTVPDVDIEADDNGPGSVHVTEIWDPIMADLGYERKNSTASDPGDPGGPNSVNHVYVPTDAATMTINGVAADIGTVFVWAAEDMTGASYDSSNPPLEAGYRIDVSADVAADAVPIPLLAAIADAMPVPDGAELVDASLRLQQRTADSFDADQGLDYLDLTIEWAAAPGATPDQLAAFYADQADFDGDVLIAAEPSFFNEGTYEPAEVSSYGDTDYRLPVLLLARYEGVLSLSAPTDDGEPAELSYRITLNPTDSVLSPPE